MAYTWKFKLDERGFKEVPFTQMTENQLNKNVYVEEYLSPSIQFSNCGWHHCVYYVLENAMGKEEYVALYPEKENEGGRYINVSGNSLGAISQSVWENVFN